MTPFLFMLVGIPGAGKSTFIGVCEDFLNQSYCVLSTDEILQNEARRLMISYDQLFSNESYQACEKLMFASAQTLFAMNRTVIWDQTNLTRKSRARKLAMVPKHYKKVAIAIETPPDLNERLSVRSQISGKTIPDHVVSSMVKSFEIPTLTEGFDLVFYKNHDSTQFGIPGLAGLLDPEGAAS